MATANDVLRIAAGEIGYNRWDDPQQGTKYGRWYAQITNSPYFGTNGIPFCAMFVSYVLNQAGQKCAGFPTASCGSALSGAKAAGIVLSNIRNTQAGDIVIFDWGKKDNSHDHVGFVELNKGGYIQTVEGNTSPSNSGSQGNGGGVYRRTRDWSVVQAIIRPVYGVKPAPKPKPPLPDALKKFTDLDSEAWYIKPLEAAVKAGYINGCSDGTMKPNDPITRAQAVCVISNAAGFKSDEPFSDVKANPYYYKAVEWAKENGVVSGSSNKFNPDDVCTREQFLAMMYNWNKGNKAADPTNFSDWDKVSNWAKDAVSWAVGKKVISGNGGKIRPTDACTRAEAAAMLVNLKL